MINKLWSILLFLAICSCIEIKNRKLYDDEGREIRFRGPNVVVKVPPYMPRTDAHDPVWSFAEEDMVECRRLGYNGIRLGMMYSFAYVGGQVLNRLRMATTKPIWTKWRS